MESPVKNLFTHLALVTLITTGAGCAQDFQAQTIDSNSNTTSVSKAEGSCGEGKCGEGKCGQGACGVQPGEGL